MLTLNQIHAAMQERLNGLREAKDEYDRLEKALAALDAVTNEPEPAAPKRRGRPRKATS
jgi:hypothetical protein